MSNRIILKVRKFQHHSLNISEVIPKEIGGGGGGAPGAPPPGLDRVNKNHLDTNTIIQQTKPLKKFKNFAIREIKFPPKFLPLIN